MSLVSGNNRGKYKFERASQLSINNEPRGTVPLKSKWRKSILIPKSRQQRELLSPVYLRNSEHPMVVNPTISSPLKHAEDPVVPAEISSIIPPQTPEMTVGELPAIPPLHSFRGGLGLRKVLSPEIHLPIQPISNGYIAPLSELHINKETCTLCLNKSIHQYSGIRLQCGHAVHRTCLRQVAGSLKGCLPVCAACGKVCVKLHDLKRTSSRYSKDSLNDIPEEQHSPCDVEPLSVETFVQQLSEDTYGLFIRLKANCNVSRLQWKHEPTSEEQSIMKRVATEVVGITQLANQAVDISKAGQIRLITAFQNGDIKVTANLFERYAIIITNSHDGFPELIAIFDLEDEDTEIRYDTAGRLKFKNLEKELNLDGAKEHISSWVAAVNDHKLSFPVVANTGLVAGQLRGPINFGYVESITLDCVLCIPIVYVAKVVSQMLEKLGPQDRLGIISVTQDGSSAFITPHKPSWPGWNEVTHFGFDSCGLFTLASMPILDTATEILGEDILGKQKSIIVVSGCPLASTIVSRPITVHAIGIKEDYDFNLMKSITEHSSNGRFCHVTSIPELSNCCAGLAAADRTYMHHNVSVAVDVKPDATVTSTPIKFDDTTNTNTTVTIPIGSLMAGQTRTISLDIKANNVSPQTILAECKVNSFSAVTGKLKETLGTAVYEKPEAFDFVAKPIYFDRLALFCANIMCETMKMAEESKIYSIRSLLNRASLKIDKSTVAASKFTKEEQFEKGLFTMDDSEQEFEALIYKSRVLSTSLKEIHSNLDKGSMSNSKVILYEAYQVLRSQCAISNKTTLERIFFEPLNCNRI